MKNLFLITGAQRSGTTYLSSLLNSQKKTFCFEYGISKLRKIKNKNDLNIFNSGFNAITMNYPTVNIEEINQYPLSKDRLILKMSKNISNFYKTDNFGFKETLLSKKDIQYFINLNFKVIIIKRVFHDMFKSYLNRFQTNETKAIFAHKEYLEKIEYYHFNKKEKRQIQIINYEDLVYNKPKTFNQISSFLDFKISMPKKFYHNFSKNVSYLRKFKNTSYSKKISFKEMNISKKMIKKYTQFMSPNWHFNLLYLKYVFSNKISKKKILLIILSISILLNLVFFDLIRG